MKALGRLHLGLTPWDYDATISAARVTAQATRAEALGYESFWLPEHHFSGAQANPSPLLLLAAVAAVTPRSCSRCATRCTWPPRSRCWTTFPGGG
jgi:alkanesulfonate monooxygenase SsuD/methylene tetrahydromethanopterin reductase-like flavin-dependent oxidoreductase (luciferase family)